MIESVSQSEGELAAIHQIAKKVEDKQYNQGTNDYLLSLPKVNIDSLLKDSTIDYIKVYGSYDELESALINSFNVGFKRIAQKYNYLVKEH